MRQTCIVLIRLVLGYMLLELPAGLSLRYIHPRYVFSAALICFGTFSACMAVTDGYAGPMVLRVLVGLAEVFVSNGWIYISLWYRPSELSLRAGTCAPSIVILALANLQSCHLLHDPSSWCYVWPHSLRLWQKLGGRARHCIMEVDFRKSMSLRRYVVDN